MEDDGERLVDFLCRYDGAEERLLDCIDCACAAESEWPLGVRAAVSAALGLLAAEPDLGQVLLFAPFGAMAGPDAQRRHEATLTCLEALLRAGREQIDAQSMPVMVEEGLVGALCFIIARPLRAGEPDLLPALAPDLTIMLLSPYLGREEAERLTERDL